jgi:hypothetical protein
MPCSDNGQEQYDQRQLASRVAKRVAHDSIEELRRNARMVSQANAKLNTQLNEVSASLCAVLDFFKTSCYHSDERKFALALNAIDNEYEVDVYGWHEQHKQLDEQRLKSVVGEMSERFTKSEMLAMADMMKEPHK